MEKKSGTSAKEKSLSKTELEEALLNNFVNLQKVLTNLAIKFDDLSNNISSLLQLFEISAKSFADKYSGGGEDKEFLKKLDSLLDQNKTIAKGIMLMEERVRQRNNTPMTQAPSSQAQEKRSSYRTEEMQRSRPLPEY